MDHRRTKQLVIFGVLGGAILLGVPFGYANYKAQMAEIHAAEKHIEQSKGKIFNYRELRALDDQIRKARKAMYANKLLDATAILDKVIVTLGTSNQTEAMASWEDATKLRLRCRVFHAMTKDFEPGPFVAAPDLHLLTRKGEKGFIARVVGKTTKGFRIIKEDGDSEVVGFDEVEAIEFWTWSRVSRRFIDRFNGLKADAIASGDPLEIYRLVQFAGRNRLDSLVIPTLEEALRSEDPSMLIRMHAEDQLKSLRKSWEIAEGRVPASVPSTKSSSDIEKDPEFQDVLKLLGKGQEYYSSGISGLGGQRDLKKAKEVLEKAKGSLDRLNEKYPNSERLRSMAQQLQQLLYDVIKNIKVS